MRLLLITNRYPTDADDPASPFVPHFASALAERGVEVDVLTPSYGRLTRNWHGGAQTSPHDAASRTRVFRFETGTTSPVGSWNLLSPWSWVRLARFVKSGQVMGKSLCSENTYDHILALWALPSGHFASVLSREFHVPYSVWCLGSDIYTWARRPGIRSRIAAILSGASNVFADGEDLRGRIQAWLGIDATFLPSFRPLDGLDGCQPSAPTESPRFLCLGRLHRDKGIIELLTAFAHVRMALPLATLQYVGDGPGKAELEQIASDMHLYRRQDPDAGSVHIRGAASHDGVVHALRDCDFVVIPTRSDSIPLVFSEAVQAMRPVIGTDIGDLGVFIRRFGLGYVSPSTRCGDLASAMVRMAHEPLFDLQGRDDLLHLFDPKRAAGLFCERVFPPARRRSQERRVEYTADVSLTQ
jgi:glycosyltransferase involved in cell wall biosynthesis